MDGCGCVLVRGCCPASSLLLSFLIRQDLRDLLIGLNPWDLPASTLPVLWSRWYLCGGLSLVLRIQTQAQMHVQPAPHRLSTFRAPQNFLIQRNATNSISLASVSRKAKVFVLVKQIHSRWLRNVLASIGPQIGEKYIELGTSLRM